jgi:hypothetical protein
MSWEIPLKVELGSKLAKLPPRAQVFFWMIWDGLDRRSRENVVIIDLERMMEGRINKQPVYLALQCLEDADLLTRPAGVGNQWGTVMINPKYIHTFALEQCRGNELASRQAIYERERTLRRAKAEKRRLERSEVSE